MNPKVPITFSKDSSSCGPADSFEETLRLLAHAPIPEGLADRVQTALRRPPQAGRVLAWPTRPAFENGWMRAAAAAAIVFVVAGGGWGIYSRVQPAGLSKNVVAPPRAIVPGGFSSAGAVRTPQTLNGPILTHPTVVAPQAMPKSGISAKGKHVPAPLAAPRAPGNSVQKPAVPAK